MRFARAGGNDDVFAGGGERRGESCGRGCRSRRSFVDSFFGGKSRSVCCGARDVASGAGVFDAGEVAEGGGALLLEGNSASATSVAGVGAAGVAGRALVVGDDDVEAPEKEGCVLRRDRIGEG